MIFNIGYLILVIALVVALFGVVVGYWGGYRRQSNYAAASFHAVYAVAALVTAASVILWYGLLTDKFQLSYVWNHSERALPVFYKFAALWGGQSGSLLFWALILSVYSLVLALSFRRTAGHADAFCQRNHVGHLILFSGPDGLRHQSF